MLSRWFYFWTLKRLHKMGHYDLIDLMGKLNNELAKRKYAEHHTLESEEPPE